jgi:DNA-binding transcriptional LysR family regulator
MDAYSKRFARLYPEVDLQLEYLHPDEVYEQVSSDEADLGLVSFPRDGGELASIPWREQQMAVVVGPHHRLAGRVEIPVDELDGEDYVGFTSELTIRRQVDRWLKQAKVAVNVVHEFDNIETIKRAVEIGSGVAILPLPTVNREHQAGALCALSVQGVDWRRPLGVVHKRSKVLTLAASKFVELLQEDPQTFRDGSFPAGGPRSAAGREQPIANEHARVAAEALR